jgi:predicted metal-binding protein
MFRVYLDDSGTDPNQPVAIATAFVVPVRQIARLESEWNTLKKKEGFDSLHFSAMVAKNPKTEYVDWDNEKQVRVTRRLCDISRKYGNAYGAVSFAVMKSDYDEVVPARLREAIGIHFTWAIRHIVSFLDSWRKSANVTAPLEYVFDWMGDRRDPRRKEIEEVMCQAESLANLGGKEKEYTNYSFQHRKDVPGLQCVDGLGWVCYRHALLTFRGTPLPPLAEESWKRLAANVRNDSWLQVFTLTRASLADWARREMEEGKSLKRFDEWKKSRTTTA